MPAYIRYFRSTKSLSYIINESIILRYLITEIYFISSFTLPSSPHICELRKSETFDGQQRAVPRRCYHPLFLICSFHLSFLSRILLSLSGSSLLYKSKDELHAHAFCFSLFLSLPLSSLRCLSPSGYATLSPSPFSACSVVFLSLFFFLCFRLACDLPLLPSPFPMHILLYSSLHCCAPLYRTAHTHSCSVHRLCVLFHSCRAYFTHVATGPSCILVDIRISSWQPFLEYHILRSECYITISTKLLGTKVQDQSQVMLLYIWPAFIFRTQNISWSRVHLYSKRRIWL